MKGDDLREQIKLRDDADYDLRQIEKTRQDDKERTNEAKTAEKVNEHTGSNGRDGGRQYEHKNSAHAAPTAASEAKQH